ncbi:MAG: hypothetical protein AAF335_02420 [Bacteroidota bacterium]
MEVTSPDLTKVCHDDDTTDTKTLQHSQPRLLPPSTTNHGLFSSNHFAPPMCNPPQSQEQFILSCLSLASKEYSLQKSSYNPLACSLIDLISTTSFEKSNKNADFIIKSLQDIFPQYYQKTLNFHSYNNTNLQPSLSTQPVQIVIPSPQVTPQHPKTTQPSFQRKSKGKHVSRSLSRKKKPTLVMNVVFPLIEEKNWPLTPLSMKAKNHSSASFAFTILKT